MAKGYEKEKRFFVHVIKEREEIDGFMVAKGEPEYLTNTGTTKDFVDARHYESFDSAEVDAKSWKAVQPDWSFVVRSMFVEVIGFDLGVIIQ